MKMIGYQRPRKTLCFCVGNDFPQPLNKEVSVVIIIKHFSTAYSPGNNMVQCSWGIYTGFSWHAATMANEKSKLNL